MNTRFLFLCVSYFVLFSIIDFEFLLQFEFVCENDAWVGLVVERRIVVGIRGIREGEEACFSVRKRNGNARFLSFG